MKRFVFFVLLQPVRQGAGEEMLDEGAEFAPVTAVRGVEGARRARHLEARRRQLQPDLHAKRDRVRGSPRLRLDVVVNNLVGTPQTTGEVVIQSDGTPWRPLVHIEDISAPFVAALEAPRELVHDEAFNVGANSENYRIREVAGIVEEVVPGLGCLRGRTASPDTRSYRVDCSKLARVLPAAARSGRSCAAPRNSSRLPESG